MSESTKPTPSAFRAVSCSGASNAGEYADKVTRLLDSEGVVNMNCLPLGLAAPPLGVKFLKPAEAGNLLMDCKHWLR